MWICKCRGTLLCVEDAFCIFCGSRQDPDEMDRKMAFQFLKDPDGTFRYLGCRVLTERQKADAQNED